MQEYFTKLGQSALTAEGYEDGLFINPRPEGYGTCSVINPRPEGYGTCSVIRSFVHSFIRSVHRAAEMSGRFYALVRL